MLLFLDIDDTVLSSKIGVKYVDKNVTHLINLIYRNDPNKLYFLTARDYDLRQVTLKHLNRAKLVHDGKFIYYNVIHSPYKIKNGKYIPTKGETLINFLDKTNLLSSEIPNWIVFVDDDIEQIKCVNDCLIKFQPGNINYKLYYYL